MNIILCHEYEVYAVKDITAHDYIVQLNVEWMDEWNVNDGIALENV